MTPWQFVYLWITGRSSHIHTHLSIGSPQTDLTIVHVIVLVSSWPHNYCSSQGSLLRCWPRSVWLVRSAIFYFWEFHRRTLPMEERKRRREKKRTWWNRRGLIEILRTYTYVLSLGVLHFCLSWHFLSIRRHIVSRRFTQSVFLDTSVSEISATWTTILDARLFHN